MAYEWQTLEQAAILLGVSGRTLHRRINKGEVETRLQAGRREVLVCLPDNDPKADAKQESDNIDPVVREVKATVAGSGGGGEGGEPTTKALVVAEERLRRADFALASFQRSLAGAEDDLHRARKTANVAWSIAAVLVAGLFIITIWATHSVTEANAQARQSGVEIKRLSDTAGQVETYRQQSTAAQIEAARAEGALSVKPPATTQPGSLLQLLNQLANR